MKAIQKFIDFPPRQELSLVKSTSIIQSLPQSFNKLILPTEGGYLFINYNEIIRCEACGNYTSIHVLEQPVIIISKTLKWIQEKVDSKMFLRVHQSHLVNIQFITKYEKGIRAKMHLDKVIVPVAKSKKRSIEYFFNF